MKAAKTVCWDLANIFGGYIRQICRKNRVFAYCSFSYFLLPGLLGGWIWNVSVGCDLLSSPFQRRADMKMF
jgi:hypothetical protein